MFLSGLHTDVDGSESSWQVRHALSCSADFWNRKRILVNNFRAVPLTAETGTRLVAHTILKEIHIQLLVIY